MKVAVTSEPSSERHVLARRYGPPGVEDLARAVRAEVRVHVVRLLHAEVEAEEVDVEGVVDEVVAEEVDVEGVVDEVVAEEVDVEAEAVDEERVEAEALTKIPAVPLATARGLAAMARSFDGLCGLFWWPLGLLSS